MPMLMSTHIIAPLLVLANLAAHSRAEVVAAAEATTPCTTAVAACHADAECSGCLAALSHFRVENRATNAPHIRTMQRDFFQAILTTPPCLETATPAATESMAAVLHAASTAPIIDQCATPFDRCQANAYQCAQSPQCRTCLDANYSPDRNSATLLQSANCTSTPVAMLLNLTLNCWKFPGCTYAKTRCPTTSPCGRGWAALARQQNATAAVAACHRNETTLRALDLLVENCVAMDSVGCGYWRVRCESDPDCSACLGQVGNPGQSPQGVALGTLTPSCRAAMRNATWALILSNYMQMCPVDTVTPCATAAYGCIRSDQGCADCILGRGTNTTSSSAAACAALRDASGMSGVCVPCSDTVALINTIVYATSAVGAVSTVACLGVIVAVVASRKSELLRYRIVVGLMIANAVYSSANTVPLNLLKGGADTQCGEFVLSFATIRFVRACWFCGKYALVLYEVFILAASIRALSRKRKSATTHIVAFEVAGHSLCALGAVVAFSVFYARCLAINNAGYNLAMQDAAESSSFSYLNTNDALDDDVPKEVAGPRFHSARSEYDALVQMMLQVWVGLVGVALLLWLLLQRMFARLVSAWQHRLADAEDDWNRDLWHESQRPVRRMKHRLLLLAKEGFEEVAKPLQPFVVVFVIFAIPALVMATDYCASNSGASLAVGDLKYSSETMSFGVCDVTCELALAFRSLATVCVYFWAKEHRADLGAANLLTKFWHRAVGCCGCVPARRHSVKFRDDHLE
eukprot:m.344043 g.344043  ORF g.344043 m.344043 type:complete len:749 (+) comp27876_c0_seq4:228-2474(+)